MTVLPRADASPAPAHDYPYQKKIEDSISPVGGKRYGSALLFLAHLTSALYFLLVLIYGSYTPENFLFLPRCTRIGPLRTGGVLAP
jgi:hypothetical protein